MSITAREWEAAMEYLHCLEDLEDLLEAFTDAEDYKWPDGVKRALERAKAMKYVWYNREE